MQTSTSVEALFAAALRHHQAGALREAEQDYQRVLALDPAHVDALHHFGVLAYQTGRNEIAAEMIRRAIAGNDRIAECHYNLGLALGALGRFDEAVSANDEAIRLKPDYAEAYMNRGNAQKAVGRLAEAKASYAQALALKPLAAAHFNLANVLSDEGKLGDAISHYGKALALRPNYAEALANLGAALLAQRKNEEALAYFERAFALNPRLSAAAHNLARMLIARGQIGRALAILCQAQEREETAETRALLADCFCHPRAASLVSEHPDGIRIGIQLRPLLLRAIAEGWEERGPLAGSSHGLVKTALAVLTKTNPALAVGIGRAIQAWPLRLSAEELLAPNGWADIARDDLFRCLLAQETLNSIELEKFLSLLRAAMLKAASGNDHLPDETLSLFSALAQQCFNNEYVFAAPAAEVQAASAVRSSLHEARTRGGIPKPIQVAVVASYFPLSSLQNAERLLQAGLPAEVAPLLKQQIAEPMEERRYRAAMPRLTAIEDAVSRKVADQYEENPYPRWQKVASGRARPMKIDAFIRARFPTAFHQERIGETDYLVAGCGTGHQLASLKSVLDVDRLLAIDLSLASLGYAKRMAIKLGLTGIEFAQADILQLPSLGRQFDVVDSGGVLHHLADPEAGWRALLSVLRPGGLMRIGLYSELARGAVVLARDLIARRGYKSGADEIRRFRQEIFALDEKTPLRKLAESADFYNLSGCRDLLFHAEEHRFRLPQIARFLRESGLRFLGFDIGGEVLERYRGRFPHANAETDLESWNAFEQENPDTFLQMYQFWLQKPVM
jgi:tetratricopeptide (TPR) repeat protein/SAM-dependent methyltransferase